MSRFSSFLLGLVTGALVLYAAMNHHVVRAADGFHFVNKQPPRLADTYVDIRGWGATEWASRPHLASDLARTNQPPLLGDAASSAIHDGVTRAEQLLPSRPNISSPQQSPAGSMPTTECP